jgi:REP element-mobilizing transposase RayT
MARTARINKVAANYHIMSRTNGKQFLFKEGKLKSAIIGILRRVSDFSGVKVHAYCMMDDHFHIVCNIVKNSAPLPEKEVIRRIGRLKGSVYAAKIAEKLLSFRKNDELEQAEAELDKWRRRMNDISEFTKTFKEFVNIVYKKDHPYCGSIWSGRFKSTLIEDGKYLRNCIRYVEFNPVRAKIVSQAKDYAWSSQAAFSSARDSGGFSAFEGSVPNEERWEMKKWVQVGNGKIFGSRGFVETEIGISRSCFHSCRVRARQVAGSAYAAYGQRLSKKSA